MSESISGTGKPEVDVPAVQGAMDEGGEVFLEGQFNFGPTGNVLVSRAVRISAEDVTIEGGQPPFTVETSDPVTIKNLRFSNVSKAAIEIHAVRDLLIAGCTIKQVIPVPTGQAADVASGIVVAATPGPILGTLEIVDNDITVGGTNVKYTIGIFVVGVGVQGKETTLIISRNRISSITRHGIDVRNIVAKAAIGRNVIVMGEIGAQLPNTSGDQFVDGIRCWGYRQLFDRR